MLGSDTVVITNGGPTEPQDPAGNTHPARDAGGPEPGRQPVREGPAARHTADARSRSPTSGTSSAASTRTPLSRNPAIDSNPVDIIRDGLRFAVADAGGNAVDTFDLFGRVRNLTVFENRNVPNPFNPQAPPIPMQAVPTSIEEGPDGHYYVGQLTGFPFPVGGANVYRVNPYTGRQTVFASGFTNIMDLAFGRDGTLYVLEIDHDGLLTPASDGAIFAVNRKGTRRIELPAGVLPYPGGITVGKDGLYVSINSRSPGGGQVMRIRG